MRINFTDKVGNGTVTHFYIIPIETLFTLCTFRKCLSNSNKNFLPMLVATLQLYGGLNHTVFRPLFLSRVRPLFSVSG